MQNNQSENNLTANSGFIDKYQHYISEFVYGGIDGCVTTFAVVSGSAGASLDSSIIIILGFANLIADGFSMSVGSYLSNKSENENFEKNERAKRTQIEEFPEEEKKEVKKIFRSKGFSGTLLDKVVRVITSNKNQWVDLLMKEELGMIKQIKPPLAMALVTFVSFIFVGVIPLVIYIADYISPGKIDYLFRSSIAMTSLAFIGIGFLKSLVAQTGKLKSIGETLFLGTAAALLAYYTGHILEKLF